MEPTRQRLFISYRHGSEDSPQESIIRHVYDSFSGQHDVFTDKDILPGNRWGEQIMSEIASCDVFVPLLTPEAMWSEMVIDEISRAHRLLRASGKPRMVPVRVRNKQDFPYPLSAYLNLIQWYSWDSDANTEGLLECLDAVLTGGAEKRPTILIPRIDADMPPAPIAPLEVPTGALHPDSKYYVCRASDRVAEDTLQKTSVTINVKGSRQMGKTSLLARLKRNARNDRHKVVSLDFQLFDDETLQQPDLFYPAFCMGITDALRLVDTFETHRHRLRTLPKTCTRFMEQDVLPAVGARVMLVMDEVDKVFAAPFRNDFFGMVRSWHDLRSDSDLWMSLELVLCSSTEPSHFISAESTQSPFNVGERILMEDFTKAEVGDLVQRHGIQPAEIEEEELYHLLRGHPFLTRRALYLLAARRIDFETLRRTATLDDGPFGDHLRYYLTKLYELKYLLPSFEQVLNNGTCPDPRLFDSLKGFGLVAGEEHRARARNPLYSSYFSQRLHFKSTLESADYHTETLRNV
jgi:hypothetical protein